MFSLFVAMCQTDAILSSLGVEDREDVDQLVSYFFDDKEKLIHPNDLTKAIRCADTAQHWHKHVHNCAQFILQTRILLFFRACEIV